MISVFFLMVWLLNSQGMKNCKSTESFCCSILAIYTNEWSTVWYVYCCYVYFFSARFLNMYKPRTTFYISFEGLPTWIGILWKCASMITQLAGIECRLAWFHAIRNLLANKIYHFPGCPIKQASFLPGQPTPCNQLLIWPLLLVPECYLHKMLKLAFWNFNPIFLRI